MKNIQQFAFFEERLYTKNKMQLERIQLIEYSRKTPKKIQEKRQILSTAFFTIQIKKVHNIITAGEMRRREGYKANYKESYKGRK